MCLRTLQNHPNNNNNNDDDDDNTMNRLYIILYRVRRNPHPVAVFDVIRIHEFPRAVATRITRPHTTNNAQACPPIARRRWRRRRRLRPQQNNIIIVTIIITGNNNNIIQYNNNKLPGGLRMTDGSARKLIEIYHLITR